VLEPVAGPTEHHGTTGHLLNLPAHGKPDGPSYVRADVRLDGDLRGDVISVFLGQCGFIMLLGWKLAMVLQEKAAPDLLGTYAGKASGHLPARAKGRGARASARNGQCPGAQARYPHRAGLR
jgi:hypothetical protein